MVLLKILRKLKEREREVRILLLGLDNAGKTTIVKKLNGEDVETVSPTLGFDIKTLHFMGYKLNIWDVGGQTTLRSYWRNYFEETDALVWVVDSADKRRLDDCRRELHALLKQERLAGASVLILANKQDLAGSLDPKAIAEALELTDEAFASRHWTVQPCSGVSGDGLLDGLTWLIKDVTSKIFVTE